MKKFRFSLETVLEYKNQALDALRAEHGAILALSLIHKMCIRDRSMRMDDNGVNVVEQETEATRNAYQMQYTIDALNSNLSLIRTLVRGQ